MEDWLYSRIERTRILVLMAWSYFGLIREVERIRLIQVR
jgi:hypothetical protein